MRYYFFHDETKVDKIYAHIYNFTGIPELAKT